MTKRKTSLVLAIPFFLVFFLLFGSLPRETRAMMTTEEEKKLGKKIFLEMEGKIGVVRDLTLQTYIDKMGRSLLAQVGPTPFEFKFTLINAPDPNAYALPGGYIFLTTGLIILADNEHEVAGVLSHEISHVTSRHVAQMVERAKRLNIATMAAVIAGMLLGGGGKSSEAISATAMATAEALALKYTREMEVDADQSSLQTILRAGYDPNGLIDFLNKIYRVSLTQAPKIPTYLSTHPAIENRISLMETLLQIGQKPAGPIRKIGNFKRVQAKAFVEERESHVAMSHFQSRVDGNPQDLNELYGLGLAYRKMGRLDKSVETLHQAHTSAPGDLDILRELGVSYFLSGKLDQAIEKLEAMKSIPGESQEDVLGLYYLGRGYQEKVDFTRALPLFQRVRVAAPEFMDVYLNLGSVYGRMGQKGLSHFYFGKHFKLRGDQKNALLHFQTASEWLERGSPEREEIQREIRDLAPTK